MSGYLSITLRYCVLFLPHSLDQGMESILDMGILVKRGVFQSLFASMKSFKQVARMWCCIYKGFRLEKEGYGFLTFNTNTPDKSLINKPFNQKEAIG